MGVAWAGFATLAFGVTIIGVLSVFVVSLLHGRPEDPWLLRFAELLPAIFRAGSFSGEVVRLVALSGVG
jgi:hypothetical protein